MSERLSQESVPADSLPPEATGKARLLWRRLVPGVPASVWRALWWALCIGYFIVALALLVLRYAVLPEIDRHRGDLERALSDSLGLRVSVAAVDAHWQGLRPYLGLHQLQIFDRNGRLALSFDRVNTEFAWSSLLFWDLRLHRLDLANPTLEIRREADGQVYVGGIALNAPGERGGFVNWLLKQNRIVIRDATLHWDDAQRAAPRLTLSRVNLRLENHGARHLFGITAEPPRGLAARLDVRGDLRGRDPDRLDRWRGQAYAALDYADLAVWRTWLDYPIDLPRGSGALRLWLDFADRQVESLTADVALADVELRLARELRMLELRRLSGRLSAKLPVSGFEFTSRQLALETRDAVRIEPTDALLRWTPAAGKRVARGDLVANQLDLLAVAKLADFLPLDVALKQRLNELAPRGGLADLKVHWGGSAERLTDYAFRARLDAVGLEAQGDRPGFNGISGTVEGSERGGRLILMSRNGAVDLPAVFPEPRIAFQELNTQATWSVLEGEAGVPAKVDVELQSLSFINQDAAGSAFGNYRYTPGTPGEIDLSAQLTRGEGPAVWRYLPLAVGANVREWLRKGLFGGRSGDTKLRLKGELEHFPFVDSKLGTFQVSGRFAGAKLRYAQGWPELTDIDGTLLFEGKRMLIQAGKASIFGVRLTDVQAEIPDLLTHTDEILNLKGRGTGPTQDFLRYIEASPVGEHIDHFTKDMRADGAGTLRIGATMNLRGPARARVKGEFELSDNRIFADPALPALTSASGRIQFTESELTLRDGSASLLGSPLSIAAQTGGDGELAIDARGSATIANMRQELSWPMLDHLSGTTAWRAQLKVRKNAATMTFDSDLRGLASSLPEPFNKSAAEAMALRFERLQGPQAANVEEPLAAGLSAGHDLLRASLGTAGSAVLMRRRDGSKYVVERGGIGVGEAAPLPERGVALAAKFGFIDGDAWRRVLAVGGGAGAEKGTGTGLPIDSITLRAARMTVFDRSFEDLGLRASLREDIWHAQVTSGELIGTLSWQGQGRGRLVARLKELALAEVESDGARPPGEDAHPKELPSVDLTAEAFSLRGKALGKLELLAANQADSWKIERLSIANPEGSLSGKGEWRGASKAGQGSSVRLDFKLESNDAGKLLDRLGYADMLRRGAATLDGDVVWQGVPTRIDYPSLDGSLRLNAKSGQFNKLDPGVGRLLGVLSLQALPRRITLDFRDVFSEGFAFDSISGSMNLRRGIMDTQDLSIQGPAAKVRMVGEVNLTQETQDMRVRVQPTLSESVAIGAAIANPVAGVAAFVAQKMFKDPIEQMFAFEYAVTGGWADPKVERIERSLPQVGGSEASPPRAGQFLPQPQ